MPEVLPSQTNENVGHGKLKKRSCSIYATFFYAGVFILCVWSCNCKAETVGTHCLRCSRFPWRRDRPGGFLLFALRMLILLMARSQASVSCPSPVLKFHPHSPFSLHPMAFFTCPYLLHAGCSLTSPSVSFNPFSISLSLFARFHLAATRGHLECLNLILGHSVDVTATDATGEFRLDESRISNIFFKTPSCQ